MSFEFNYPFIVSVMSNPPSPKRARVINEEGSSNRPKYPFVDSDAWMDQYEPFSESSPKIEYKTPSVSGSVPNFIRPQTTWFAFAEDSKFTSECMSAQYSNVAHCPFVQGQPDSGSGPESDSLWIDKTLLFKYIEIKGKIPSCVTPSYYADPIFKEAVLADIIANAARRDPTKYASIKSPGRKGLLGIEEESTGVALVVTDYISDSHHKLPWEWEKIHRVSLLSHMVDGYDSLVDFGDMVVPIRGFVCSVFLAGVIFRLGQLFQKVTVVRSPLCMHWDDQAYIVCIGKRKINKYVEKALKLFRRLVAVPEENQAWGYAVPPVCIKDPTVCTWIRDMNRALMTSLVFEKSLTDFPTLERWVTSLRIKKYVFWKEAKEEHLIGFYFGSFNPVHENHIALVKYANKQLGMEKVYLVPNQDGNKEKGNEMVSFDHRMNMIKTRMGAEAELGFVETLEPVGNTQRWETKANIAEGTTNKLYENSRLSGQPVLILGQDSWNKAVIGSSRDKTTRHFIGIAKIVKSKIYVFPRSANSSEEIVNPPKPIRELVKVIEGYVDPIEGLSSSSVRDQLRENAGSGSGLHAAVREYIDRNNLYR